MSYPLFGAFIAALVTAGLLWMTLPFALRVGMVDKPGGRKDHSVPTPTIGGVAIAIGLFAASFLFGQPDRALLSLFAAGSMLLVVGALDDQYDVRWYWRVLAQVAAALILIFWGEVRVSHIGPLLGSSPFELGLWSVPFTVLGTVGVINAINMCDGVDGLAGVVCTAALMMLGITALYAGNTELLAQVEPMLGALLAFLLFNMRSPWVKRHRTRYKNVQRAGSR